MPPHPLSNQTLGIILAAGRGRRMGTLKQTLPWGNSTLIAHIFDSLQPHCAAGIAVVVGSHKNEITAALNDRIFSIVQSDTTAQQYQSIVRGLDFFLNKTTALHTLLQPADHPHIPTTIITTLFNQISPATKQQTAIIPTFQNKGGHPVLIPRTVATRILAWTQTISKNKPENFQGLKTFWHQNPNLIRKVETNEPKITIDLDTPTDYQQQHPGKNNL